MRFKCTIHNKGFEYEEIKDEDYVSDCPFCLQDEIKILKEEIRDIKGHRDALLRAIEIKRTVEPR